MTPVRRDPATPIGAIVRGLAAGLVGTAAMTLVQELKARASEGSSSDEGGEQSWQGAPAPAQAGRRVIEGVFKERVGEDKIPILTHGMHWAYGTMLGALYGVAQETIRAHPLVHGVAFGAGAWVLAYAQLVPMGLYDPPWKYRPSQLATDLGYHVAYGLGVAGAYHALNELRS